MAKGRKDARTYTRPEVERMSSYHGGDFETLTFYNSDRKIKLNRNYTVSNENPDGIKKFFKAGSHVKAYGLEVETVGEPITLGRTVYTNLLDLIFNKAGFDGDFFKIETDATVDGECITQTFSRAWMRNNYKCFKAMYELFEVFKITTDDERCGLHVNVDLSNFGNDFETQTENARKLGYVIQKHYNLMKIAFNRTGSTRWCGRMSTTRDYWENTPLDYFPSGHENSYNMSHIRENRIEIRLVGGQKNYPCFRNTMETVFFLIDRVCKLSWKDLDDVQKLFKGCNAHVFTRLSENCFNAGVISATDINAIRETAKLDERWL